MPMTAKDQKETFNALIEETLGETCDYQLVRNIHEHLTDMLEEKADENFVEKLELWDSIGTDEEEHDIY